MRNDAWEDALRGDVEIPQVVNDRMEQAFAQIREQATAPNADGSQGPVPPQDCIEAEAANLQQARKAASKKRWSVLNKPLMAAAAAAVGIVVIGGSFGIGTMVGGSSTSSAPATMSVQSENGAAFSGTRDAEESATSDAPLALKSTQEEVGGGSSDAYDASDEESSANKNASAPANDDAKDTAKTDEGFKSAADNQKLVYTARVSIETTDYPTAKKTLQDKVAAAGAIVSSEVEELPGSSEESSLVGSSQLTLVARVPAESYETFVESLGEVGSVVSKTSNVDNITKAYSETEAKIESLETQQKRLLELMEKAKSVDDMLYIEESLQEVRSELAAEKNYREQMDTDIAYSTVTIMLRDVTSHRQASAEVPLPERIAQAFIGGAEAFAAALAALIVGLVAMWPVLVVLAIIIVVAVTVMRKRRNKHTESESETIADKNESD